MTGECIFSLMSPIFRKCQVTSSFRALGTCSVRVLTSAHKWCIARISVRTLGCTGPFLTLRARKSVVHAVHPCSWCCRLTKVAYISTRCLRSGETLVEGLQCPVYLDDIRRPEGKRKSVMKGRKCYVISKEIKASRLKVAQSRLRCTPHRVKVRAVKKMAFHSCQLVNN